VPRPSRRFRRAAPLWLHEIKHDGYRIIAFKSGDKVRLWSRNGRDWSREFAAIAECLRAVEADELVIDGEACAHCPDGLPDFHGLRSGGASACLFAFDLLQLGGQDLRPLPLEERRARLRTTLRPGRPCALSSTWRGTDPRYCATPVRAGARGYHFKAMGLALPVGPQPHLAKGEEPGV
jgi:ATP-dependent DNA ligase